MRGCLCLCWRWLTLEAKFFACLTSCCLLSQLLHWYAPCHSTLPRRPELHLLLISPAHSSTPGGATVGLAAHQCSLVVLWPFGRQRDPIPALFGGTRPRFLTKIERKLKIEWKPALSKRKLSCDNWGLNFYRLTLEYWHANEVRAYPMLILFPVYYIHLLTSSYILRAYKSYPLEKKNLNIFKILTYDLQSHMPFML